MRLRAIGEADFRRTDQTNYNEFLKANKGFELHRNDCVMFVNSAQTLVAFAYGSMQIENAKKKELEIFHSGRIRVTGGQFDPLALSNYAEQAGIELEGIRRFQEYFKDKVAEQAAG